MATHSQESTSVKETIYDWHYLCSNIVMNFCFYLLKYILVFINYVNNWLTIVILTWLKQGRLSKLEWLPFHRHLRRVAPLESGRQQTPLPGESESPATVELPHALQLQPLLLETMVQYYLEWMWMKEAQFIRKEQAGVQVGRSPSRGRMN